MTTRHTWIKAVWLAAGVAGLVSTAGCGGELLRTGRSPVFLTLGALEAAKGSDPGTFVANLLSDVQTIVDVTVGTETVQVPTIFNDLGRATIVVNVKNVGGLISGTESPVSPLNAVTITRYRVSFRRADGHNTPGLHVPFGFDGGVNVTINSGASGEVVFDLVRHAMKGEAPLRNLIGGGGQDFISTVAEITFWGHDQNGNELTVSGLMDVTFADFGDE
jgi:hypothetical protein